MALILDIDHQPRSVVWAQNCATKTTLAECTELGGRPDFTIIGLFNYYHLSRPLHQTQCQHTKMGLLSLASDGSDDPDPCASRRSLALDVWQAGAICLYNNHYSWQVSLDLSNPTTTFIALIILVHPNPFFPNPLLQNDIFWFAFFCSLLTNSPPRLHYLLGQ